jgi:hypothetical protein
MPQKVLRINERHPDLTEETGYQHWKRYRVKFPGYKGENEEYVGRVGRLVEIHNDRPRGVIGYPDLVVLNFGLFDSKSFFWSQLEKMKDEE